VAQTGTVSSVDEEKPFPLRSAEGVKQVIIAEFERELIRTRTGEGRERAKARGVVLGRKPKLNEHQREEAIARRVSHSSIRT
jgi:hypothetical protein